MMARTRTSALATPARALRPRRSGTLTSNGQSFEAFTDGYTLWVNAPLFVARYNPMSGCDVMRSDHGCTSLPPEDTTWARFVALLHEHHGLWLDDEWQPRV